MPGADPCVPLRGTVVALWPRGHGSTGMERMNGQTEAGRRICGTAWSARSSFYPCWYGSSHEYGGTVGAA
jgi:hypothetical protein